MLCDCIKNLFKGRCRTNPKLNEVNEVKIVDPKIDLKEPLIEIGEVSLANNFKRRSFFCFSVFHTLTRHRGGRRDSYQFWKCSMGNSHPNSQEYCRCLHISAQNKFEKNRGKNLI